MYDQNERFTLFKLITGRYPEENNGENNDENNESNSNSSNSNSNSNSVSNSDKIVKK